MKAFGQFKTLVRELGLTLEQLRCDVPPTPEVMDLMDEVGPEKYEALVLRYQREVE